MLSLVSAHSWLPGSEHQLCRLGKQKGLKALARKSRDSGRSIPVDPFPVSAIKVWAERHGPQFTLGSGMCVAGVACLGAGEWRSSTCLQSFWLGVPAGQSWQISQSL